MFGDLVGGCGLGGFCWDNWVICDFGGRCGALALIFCAIVWSVVCVGFCVVFPCFFFCDVSS